MSIETEAVNAIKRLDKAGASSFITCESGPRPKVVCQFGSLREAHEFYEALIECGMAARLLEAEQQSYE